ncbi:thioredoxin family protein [Flavobacterium subsaxonicum]|uniref:Thioredoxin n=1 Tax=Flavobacterium subsaxonicum WB 4.1-42 = DSM 21790 TaxID=1121898 RepID=A0A0A2MGL9_9FLAO|nr:thioredoxin family protein [Flavobacterium subsaxonicum]KGO91439.1 thioredoxin [Flavobacterium subsaxonicum WB 4.1-42 = DSM 21790]
MITDESLIEKSLKNGFSYTEYRNHVMQLLMDGLSTGATQSEDLTHYTTLNEVRMNRLDKTIKLPEDIKNRLANLKKEHTLLVISEGWCGDAAQILPIINKMAEASDKLSIEIVLRDENAELMDAYLTNGARSIPKMVLLDDALNARASWGPRPQGGAQLIRDYKEQFGVIDQQVKTDLQKWYLQDKGHSTMEEITLLLENAENIE